MFSGIAGAAISSAAGLLGGRRQERAGQAAAEASMAFQEHSAKHRYQWTMADMRAAGLNPMLAYQQGGGPPLSGATYQPPNIAAGVEPAISHGVQSALVARRQRAEIPNLHADTESKKTQADLQRMMRERERTQAELNMDMQGRVQDERRIFQEELHSAKRAAEDDKRQERWRAHWTGRYTRWLGDRFRDINPLGSSARQLRGAVR